HVGAVVGQGAVAQRQRALALDAGPEVGNLAVGDGQAGDGDVGAAEGVEDALGAPAADGDGGGARPLDGQVGGDVQFPAGQGDGPRQAIGEVDRVAAGRGGDLATERAVAAVKEVGDGQGAEHQAVFQALQAGPEAAGGEQPRAAAG